jgi:NADH-quinone oxidoreductase subunit C
MNVERFFAAWREMGALVISRFDFQKTGLRAAAILPPEEMPVAARNLFEAGYYLETITVIETQEGLLVTYLYDLAAEKPSRLAVRTLAGPSRTLPSLALVYPGAEWHVREAADFFGLNFIGYPNPTPLLLPHDFEGPPPLLKTGAEKVAALAELKIFGEAEILNQAWGFAAKSGLQPESEGAA